MNKITLVFVVLIIIIAGFVYSKHTKASNSNDLSYREFELYGSCGIKKFVDPDNGNVCYVTNPCGYKGLSISCLAQ